MSPDHRPIADRILGLRRCVWQEIALDSYCALGCLWAASIADIPWIIWLDVAGAVLNIVVLVGVVCQEVASD